MPSPCLVWHSGTGNCRFALVLLGTEDAVGLEQLKAVSSTILPGTGTGTQFPRHREETTHSKIPANKEKDRGRKEHKKHPDKVYSLCTFINKIYDLQHVSVDSVLREFSNG